MKEIKTEVEDFEFVEVDALDVHQLCTACMCVTRTTRTLDDDTLKQYYMNILTEMQLEGDELVLQSPRLCWECTAHLKRLVRFREQVQDSYRLLQPTLLKSDKENLAAFLQCLASRPAGRLRTCCAFSINISPRDDDKHVMTADEDVDNVAAEKNYIETNPSTLQELKSHSNEKSSIIHNITHTGDMSFECDICHIIFPSRRKLIYHIRTHTVDKQFQCAVCHKSFSQKSNLYTHRRIHTSGKSFQCEICHKSFADRRNLIDHIRIHTGVKPFQCELCHKSFNRKLSLDNHIKTHAADKHFQCEGCHKLFAYKSLLVSHLKTHIIIEKLFQCEVCHRSYKCKSTLINHIKTHTDEKPFQCEVCLRKFTQNCSMIAHRRTQHTSDKPFQCKVCHKSFALKNYLKRHLKRIHS